MNCPICNSNIPDDSTFCSNCKTTFMVCSECGAYLPGDSRFCPDCGTPVVNIEELRAKAKDIVLNYKEGYEFYVKTGILPCKCYDSSAEICEKIIAMSAAIIERHKQIKEEERIRKTASSITIQYTKAYNYYVNIGAIPRFVHNLDIVQCQQIIAKKNDIIGKHYEILKQERAAEEKKKREQSTQFVLNELNRLGITDSDKRTMFLEHPDRLSSEYWLNWAKKRSDHSTPSNTTAWWEWPVAIVIIIITLLLMFC